MSQLQKDLADVAQLFPSRQLEQSEREKILYRALDQIKPDQREIVFLRDFHELSYAEIAEVLEIEAGTVMSRLHRARLALKNILLKDNFFRGDL